MPDKMPEDMSEDMSDRMPEDLPVTKRINVMMGITRSKVIFFGVWMGGNSHRKEVVGDVHPRSEKNAAPIR